MSDKKQKNKEYQRLWRLTPSGRKSNRISHWKFRGVIHHDFDELYEKFINTQFCELCGCTLTEDKNKTKTTRCLDHCHQTGEFRNIVCHSCNMSLPRQT